MTQQCGASNDVVCKRKPDSRSFREEVLILILRIFFLPCLFGCKIRFSIAIKDPKYVNQSCCSAMVLDSFPVPNNPKI